MKIVEQSVELKKWTSNPEQHIEWCGRIAHKSEDKITADSAGAFVRKLLELGHTSVFEHASATVLVVCDRGVTHEIVRHRAGISYTQESTRYCNYGSGRFGREITVIEPPGLGDNRCRWVQSCGMAEEVYLAMIEDSVPPEIARSVLPTCLKTEIAVTANFTAWRHFLKLRLSPKAHPQMREIAAMIRDILVGIAPNVFADFADSQVPPQPGSQACSIAGDFLD